MTCDQEFADLLISHNGWTNEDDHDAPDNPQCTRIVQYINMAGKTAYGCTFKGEDQDKYLAGSPYIRKPSIFWEAAK